MVSDVQKKEKYTLLEAGKILGISKSQVTVYKNTGLIVASQNENGIFEIESDEMERLIKLFFADERTFTVSEVAKILKINRVQTISDNCKKGNIKHYTLPSGRYVIPEAELLRLKERQKSIKPFYNVSKF